MATFGDVPLADITVITALTLTMIEKTGLLASITEKFRLRPTNEWTFALFKSKFQLGNKERVRRLTSTVPTTPSVPLLPLSPLLRLPLLPSLP